MHFGSSSQSGGENEKVSRFLIFVNTSILVEAAAHKKASRRPVTKCKVVLIARLQMPLPECFPEAQQKLSKIKMVFDIPVEKKT